MSSQRGNITRSRKQKYQNSKAFKNDLHDTSNKTKLIKSLNHEGLCQPCKDKIDWKVKYKKYKPLTQPATCVRCHNKCVKRAYLIVCQPCAEKAGVCAKCNQKKEIVLPVQPSSQEALAEEEMNRFELTQLPERKRRTVLRYIDKGEARNSDHGIRGESSNNAMGKLDDDSQYCDADDDTDSDDESNTDANEFNERCPSDDGS